MDRRRFSLSAASVAGALALAGAGVAPRARAATFTPVDGRDFHAIGKPLSVPANGKIEVIEFFWYGCPHCFSFEPILEAWLAKLPPDVHFTRVPVGFDALKQAHQHIYYVWEALGVVDKMHVKTFNRFHVDKKPVNDLSDMVVFSRENGLDTDKVTAAWNSFSVQTKCASARRLEDDYGIERMPEMAIAGRYVAIAQPESGPESVLLTTAMLLDRIRHGG